MIDKNGSDYSIELAWKWTTPPGVKKMGVFIMICTDVMKMVEGYSVQESVLLQIYRPSLN